ncbi:uncharacterized protein LOC127777249 [Oryza glaberrima]|uniref:uncharacterized protein LOC127777249 n=1 Tax=Oryza glaberrima TaxID=4538 RepID=UPI00224C1D04|nr:uncharacterized protein LOC127777249 [Oryza glaberrima]
MIHQRDGDHPMEESTTMARRLWHVVRAVLFMLRKGMSKRKLAMDLHLLLHRGKIAGNKALGKIMNTTTATASHGHGHAADAASTAAGEAAAAAPFSCGRALDPALAVYDPRGAGLEVEFSCSNTPSYPSSFHLIPTKRRRRNNNGSNGRRRGGGGRGANGGEPGWYNYDAADIARVFEILNSSDQLLGDGGAAVAATPSPALWRTSFGGRSPAPVRQLRITDSPFPIRDDGGEDAGAGLVDLEAEEFINKFYEQLRTQQQSLATATPDYYAGYSRPVTGVAY